MCNLFGVSFFNYLNFENSEKFNDVLISITMYVQIWNLKVKKYYIYKKLIAQI